MRPQPPKKAAGRVYRLATPTKMPPRQTVTEIISKHPGGSVPVPFASSQGQWRFAVCRTKGSSYKD